MAPFCRAARNAGVSVRGGRADVLTPLVRRTKMTERQTLELLAEDNLALRIETDDVEDVLADVDANGREGLRGLAVVSVMGCFS